ncbi:hypothetical protein FEZ32_07075 [Acidipropionibacterium jensenii]|nr:L,D-transpeptidase family protein [Acidipropionibacterium jensenii]QCV88144.1 hypothetical protein FEZ32_07075 [Acidipropionibacterium jensenii]
MGTRVPRWLAVAVTTAAVAFSGAGFASAAPSDPPSAPPSESATPTPAQAGSSTPSPSTPSHSAAPFRASLVYATGTVTVRSTPSTAGSNLGTLQRGQHVGTRDAGNGTARRGDWTAVNYQGRQAWISTQYLSATKPAPAPRPTPTPARPKFSAQLIYATTTVSVRVSPSTSSKSRGTLQRGQHVGTRDAGSGTARQGSWTAVNYKGRQAWIASRYLTTTRPAPAPKPRPKPRPAFTKYIVYATATVPVRVSPSLAARSIASLRRGDHVSAVGIAQRGFTPVNYKGRTAWVQTSYLSRSKPAPNPQRLDNRCLSGLVVCISKTDRKLRLVNNGKILITLDARFGRPSEPTREGSFKIFWKNKNHVSTLYGSRMPFAMFFSGGEAIHYSSDFAARGYVGNSHGCVNIRSWSGIQYVWNHAPVNTKVVVYR